MTERTGGRGPQFLECSSKEAIQRARDQFQLLLVYIRSDLHQDTPTFEQCVARLAAPSPQANTPPSLAHSLTHPPRPPGMC